MSIDTKKLDTLFRNCLFNEDEIENGAPKDPSKVVEVEGIASRFGLNKDRLGDSKAEVKEMLDQLPEKFKGGWTFLNMCNDKDGNQWTGVHATMEQLMALGIGLGLVRYCMPKEAWAMFPGGMPYIIVDTKGSDI